MKKIINLLILTALTSCSNNENELIGNYVTETGDSIEISRDGKDLIFFDFAEAKLRKEDKNLWCMRKQSIYGLIKACISILEKGKTIEFKSRGIPPLILHKVD